MEGTSRSFTPAIFPHWTSERSPWVVKNYCRRAAVLYDSAVHACLLKARARRGAHGGGSSACAHTCNDVVMEINVLRTATQAQHLAKKRGLFGSSITHTCCAWAAVGKKSLCLPMWLRRRRAAQRGARRRQEQGRAISTPASSVSYEPLGTWRPHSPAKRHSRPQPAGKQVAAAARAFGVPAKAGQKPGVPATTHDHRLG